MALTRDRTVDLPNLSRRVRVRRPRHVAPRNRRVAQNPQRQIGAGRQALLVGPQVLVDGVLGPGAILCDQAVVIRVGVHLRDRRRVEPVERCSDGLNAGTLSDELAHSKHGVVVDVELGDAVRPIHLGGDDQATGDCVQRKLDMDSLY